MATMITGSPPTVITPMDTSRRELMTAWGVVQADWLLLLALSTSPAEKKREIHRLPSHGGSSRNFPHGHPASAPFSGSVIK